MVFSNAGTVCIACTLILTLLEEKALEDGASPKELCQLLLGGDERCQSGALPSPDELCQDLKLCEGFPTCRLFPEGSWPPNTTAGVSASSGAGPSELASLVIAGGLSALRDAVLATSAKLPPAMLFQPASEVAAAEAQAAAEAVLKSGKVPDPCGTNISCLVYRIGTLHLPLLDGDGDAFAPVGNGDLDGLAARAARGSHWRGADCNDANAKIYPGRRAAMGDLIEDTNCNGIVGVDKASGVSYEKLWCTGAHEPRGVVVLGDSASAHFHIPPVWLSAANFSLDQIATDAPIRAADELDVPYCSWSTGHAENASAAAAQCPPVWRMPGAGEPPPSLELKSFYGRLRQRNRCNHRDFQNMGVNGARVGSIAPPHGIVNGMARNPTEDVPLIVFHALIGNDVCNGHPGMGSMTTPDAFGASVNRTLDHLEQTLPRGSTVILIGLAQGTLLYNTTHNLTHPIGTSYPALYDYLSCVGVNPCWGWLNTNATWRDATQERADQLNGEYLKLVSQRQASQAGSNSSFQLLFYNPDLEAAITQYVQADPTARTPMDCVEPCDGFHPSQPLQMLVAEQIWGWLEQEHPDTLGVINPHNAAIQATFGNQGGY